jgi:hypothetical protein
VTRGLHWFRNDLRLQDNTALTALAERAEEWLPVFVLDSRIVGDASAGGSRMRFLLDGLERLGRALEKRQVVAFHTARKLRARSTVAFRDLGRLVASLKQTPRVIFREQYERGFMQALAHVASRAQRQRLAARGRPSEEESRLRFTRRAGAADSRLPPRPCSAGGARYADRASRPPSQGRLNGQVFLEPHLKELMLRNHV